MHWFQTAFGDGIEAHHLSLLQVALRALLIFFAALVVVRIADKRFFAKKTAFDLILAFILGSMFGRAINGSERLIPTIGAGLLLALLHRTLGWMACRWPRFGKWIKGSSHTLVEKGRVDPEVLNRNRLAQDDLLEELRLNGVEDPADVELARLEQSGEISVIKRKGKPA